MAAQLFFVLLLAVVSAVSAEENPQSAKNILDKMMVAMATSSYQGTVVFLKNDKLETMKYFHTVDANGKEQERLLSLNSPQREIVRDSDEVRCHFKTTKQVIIDHRPFEHSFIVDVPRNLSEMEGIYHFDLIGEEDVAMMASYIVAIQPKDDYRYVRKIWIAKDINLPLKAVVYSASGVILEQVVFTEMRVDSTRSLSTPESTKFNRFDLKLNESAFEVKRLPDGFKQVFFTRKPLHEAGKPVEHLLLSDGFASVSVYLEAKLPNPLSDNVVHDNITSVGAVNSLSKIMGDTQLTVLGEVPVSTIKLIAENVKLRESTH